MNIEEVEYDVPWRMTSLAVAVDQAQRGCRPERMRLPIRRKLCQAKYPMTSDHAPKCRMARGTAVA